MSKPQTLRAEIAALGPEKYVRLEDVLAKVEQYEADLQKHLRSLWYSETAEEHPHYKAALEDLQYFTNIPLGFYLNTPDAELWRERNAKNAAKRVDDLAEAERLRDLIPMKFPAGTVLTHRKGGTYTVVITPDIGQLEETREPAYGYLSHTTGKLIFRSQVAMEDGRFTRVEAGT